MKSNSSNLSIVIGREYLTRVKKTSFLLMTILTPLIFAGLIFGTVMLANFSGDSEKKTVLVFDHTGEYLPILQSTEQYRFVDGGRELNINKQNEDGRADAYLVITADLLKNPQAVSLFTERQATIGLENAINSQLDNYLSNKKLESYNIPDIHNIINSSRIHLNLKARKLSDEETITGEDAVKPTVSQAEAASIVGMIFTFLIYMFIMSYGAMVMQGVMEEKNNRIVEVIVSSVRPFDLMMGKLIGIGLVGITQFAIWAVIIICVINSSALASIPVLPAGTGAALKSVNFVEISIFFTLFFIGGYLIYASLYAAIGASVNSPEDAQQFMMPLMLLIIFAFYAGFYSAQNPDGPLAFWTSLIPFTSPIVMMIRIPFDIPLWQTILSVVLLIVTAVLIIALVAKIYRVGILMYGKKPTWGELIKWIKY